MACEWLVVCLAGVTCGGKTMLAKAINSTIPGCVLLSQDDYFYPDTSEKHVYVQELHHHNYEIMESLDMEKMRADVHAVLVRDPGSAGKTEGRYRRILLLEGFLVLNDPKLSSISHVKIFITLTKEQCWARRRLRSYDPPDKSGYFENCVWPEYEKHYAIAKQLNPEMLIIDGSLPYETNLKNSLCAINKIYNSS